MGESFSLTCDCDRRIARTITVIVAVTTSTVEYQNYVNKAVDVTLTKMMTGTLIPIGRNLATIARS